MYQISCYHDMLTLYHHDILQQMNNVISLNTQNEYLCRPDYQSTFGIPFPGQSVS